MADALAAFSLAASILQFIDFSWRLLSKGKQIYKDGASIQSQHVEAALQRLQEFAINLRIRLRPPGSTNSNRTSNVSAESLILDTIAVNEHALDVIAENCGEIAAKLTKHLHAMKVQGTRRQRVWKSFHHAFEEVWGNKGIKQALDQLAAYKQEIQLHLLASLKVHRPPRP